MINVALVGTWHVHFEGYANAIQRNPICNITALWDTDEESGKRYSEMYSCDYVADYDALLKRDDVDAVMVCSSTDLHYDIIMKAAKAGKHIFTEKVLCFTEAEALEVAKAVKENNVKFCISFVWRSKGEFIWIKEAIDSGLIGEVSYARMRNAHNGTIAGWLPDTFYDPVTCGGGAMMDLGAHGIYFLNWILGDPVKATSVFTNVRVSTVEDNAVSVFMYKNGAIGINETSFLAANDPHTIEIVGDKGTIFAGGHTDSVAYNIGDGWVTVDLPESIAPPIDLWIKGIDEDCPIPYGIDDAVALSRTMEMAYKNII